MSLDGLPKLSAVEELRIGSVDDPDFGFARPYGLDIDAEGQIYVMEGSEPEIRVYSADGRRLVRRIGGRGGGPGEFMSAPSFGVVGDTIWAYEGGSSGRITLFDREGTVLSTGQTRGLRIPLWSSYGYVRPRRMLPGGVFMGELSMIGSSRDDPELTTGPTDTIPVPRVLFDATGAVIDTVGWDPSPPPRMARPPGTSSSRSEVVRTSTRGYFVTTAPTESDYWFPLPDGRIILDMATPSAPDAAVFTIVRLDLAGDTIYRRDLAYRPEPYTSDVLDSIAIRAARSGGGIVMQGEAGPDEAEAAAAARLIRDKLAYPALQQPVRGYHVGQDEALWLMRRSELGPTRWIVLDPQAVPRGELELPAGTRPVWSLGNTFWAIQTDELDIPWLVRYRLAAGS